METEDIILGKAKYEDWRSIYYISLGGQEFYYSTRPGNLASKALALSCGLVYQHSEQKTDQRSGKTYELEIYKKNLKCTGSEIE